MSAPVPPSVLEAFEVREEAPTPLSGGEGRAWLAVEVVLKPGVDPAEWAWLGEHLPEVEEGAFRLARPVRSRGGRWVVDGWGAVGVVPGRHEPRWMDVLQVSERLHGAIQHLPRPAFIDSRTSPYSIADRVAWEEADPPLASTLLRDLAAFRRPVSSRSQLVHGDLTENVLFAEGLPPAVIDFSPYFRPPGYAAAIVIGDAVRWHAADPEPLVAAAAKTHPELPQLLLRASIFRLVVGLLVDPRREDEFEPDLALVADLCR